MIVDKTDTTQQMADKVAAYLVSLGYTGVTHNERWEDNVRIVFHDFLPGENGDNYWRLDVSGCDDEDFPPGVSLVLVDGPDGHEMDPDLEMNDLSVLHTLLDRYGFPHL